MVDIKGTEVIFVVVVEVATEEVSSKKGVVAAVVSRASRVPVCRPFVVEPRVSPRVEESVVEDGVVENIVVG